MYFPVKMIAPPSAFGLKGVEDIFLETSDNVKLQPGCMQHAPAIRRSSIFTAMPFIWVSARLGSAHILMPDLAL